MSWQHLLAPWVKGRVVWHLRDFWPGRYAGFLADRGPAAIIANSRAVAQDFQKRLRHPDKITVVHNAVDPEEFSPGRAHPASRSLEQICPAGGPGGGLCPVERPLPVF